MTLDRARWLEAQFLHAPLGILVWQAKGDDFVLVDYNEEAAKVSRQTGCLARGLTTRTLIAEGHGELALVEKCFAAKGQAETRAWKTLNGETEPLSVALLFSYCAPDLVVVYARSAMVEHGLERALERAAPALVRVRELEHGIGLLESWLSSKEKR